MRDDRADAPPDDTIRDLADLEDRLSQPGEALSECLGRLDGDILILGVAGKMGPSLARMARRGSDAAGVDRRVIGVARFSDPGVEASLRSHGVETIRCDLLDPDSLGLLPDAPNVVFMAGMKFGTSGGEARTWAINAFLPGLACRRFARSRLVAFSTGNVYGTTPVGGPGSRESDPLNPRGEYAMSCVGRERIVEHHSRTSGIPAALIRLNYATEMRYGVLVDIGRKVLAGEPIDLTIGYLNAIWQGDAVDMSLRAFDHVASPPLVLNVTGPRALSVRSIAERFGEVFGSSPVFQGRESPEALLSDTSLAGELFGHPRLDIDRLLHQTAGWIRRGGETLGKPTRYEVSDGRF